MKLYVISVAILLSNVCFAETSTLADGTPVRTDKDGNQIVDYIAELEHTNDLLKERIFSLEEQLEAKKRLLARSGNQDSDVFFEEKTIQVAPSRNPEMEGELEKARNQAVVMFSELQECRERLDTTVANLDQQQAHFEEMKTLLVDGKRKVTETSSLSNLDSGNERRASIGDIPPKDTVISSSSASNISARRGYLRGMADATSEVIKKRMKLVEKHSKKSTPISLSLKDPVSERGMTLSEIRRQIEREQRFAILSRLERDLSQIEKRAWADIETLERLSKLSM